MDKRSEWIRGEEARRSYLCREHDHRRCCLGFLAEQCGIDSSLLVHRRAPSNIYTNARLTFPAAMQFLLTADRSADSPLANALMVINDAPVGTVAKVNQYLPSQADFEVTGEALREGDNRHDFRISLNFLVSVAQVDALI
jgi:hypothetical protein